MFFKGICFNNNKFSAPKYTKKIVVTAFLYYIFKGETV